MPDAPLLAACLIVRNEERNLPAALDSLAGLVDEIVVHDTGSEDSTVAIARAAGARVSAAPWPGSFAAARNAALGFVNAEWVLVLDADERADGDAAATRRALAAANCDAWTVPVLNDGTEATGGTYVHTSPRVFRAGSWEYAGAVHERLVAAGPGPHRTLDLAPGTLWLRHLGYADPATVRRKAERNADLSRELLRAALADPATDRRVLGRILVDLGRSLTSGDHEQASQAFATVRELAPGTTEAVEAGDFLARIHLASGRPRAAYELAGELRHAGVAATYCRWIEAQALAQLGRAPEALALLQSVDELVDAVGRRYELGQVVEMRSLVAALAGDRELAARELATAMLRHGRLSGRGALLLELWEGRPLGDLAQLLAELGGDRGGVIAELRQGPASARRVADLLAAA